MRLGEMVQGMKFWEVIAYRGQCRSTLGVLGWGAWVTPLFKHLTISRIVSSRRVLGSTLGVEPT